MWTRPMLQSLGMAGDPPRAFSRPVRVPDGVFDARFRTVAARTGAFLASRVYFCRSWCGGRNGRDMPIERGASLSSSSSRQRPGRTQKISPVSSTLTKALAARAHIRSRSRTFGPVPCHWRGTGIALANRRWRLMTAFRCLVPLCCNARTSMPSGRWCWRTPTSYWR